MAVNPIPPQAYTKETMLKAYSWLQNQSQNIRELATTPDILVSLFLKANRDGDSSLERPSIQNFKSELKSLAGLMGELEGSPTLDPAPSSVMTSTASAVNHSTGSAINHTSTGSATNHNTSANESRPFVETKFPDFKMAGPQGSTMEISHLDPHSQEMIREVRTQLNLSNDNEALRAIIRLGHMQITRLFR